MKAKSSWEMPRSKLTEVRDNVPSPQQLVLAERQVQEKTASARIRHANRDRKIKDKKSSGCALCKPWKHGWTRDRGQGKPKPSVQHIRREL